MCSTPELDIGHSRRFLKPLHSTAGYGISPSASATTPCEGDWRTRPGQRSRGQMSRNSGGSADGRSVTAAEVAVRGRGCQRHMERKPDPLDAPGR